MGTIAITGAASGIGAATAERLRDAGHRVITVDRHDAEVVADLGDAQGRRTAVEGVRQAAGDRLDGLVACAGLGGLPSRAGGLLVSVNYFGVIEVALGLRPLLALGQAPSVVVISSNSTTIQPNWSVDVAQACLDGDEARACRLADEATSLHTYPATKAALARWVRRHAVLDDWIGAGIRLNAIAPGMIDTPLVQESRTDPAKAKAIEELPIPAGRAGRPAEMAALIDFLLGPESTFFVGSVVFSDGGSDALLRPDDWPGCGPRRLGRRGPARRH